jgi:NADPH:quinone reductase
MPSVKTRRRVRAPRRVTRADIPAIMRAAAIEAFGDPSVLTIRTLPVPQPGAQEVLIAVDAAGVGTWDPDIRSGEWAEDDTKFPLILGIDGSGTVAAVGARVTRLSVGDRVYAYSYDNPKGGFYAEYAAVPANKAARVPRGLDAITAGALAAIGLTALQGVDDALEIAADERVIVHGASGNVGMLAVQFAKLRGARVLGVASGSDGVELVRRLGADEAIDGKEDDIEGAAKSFAPDRVDAVLAFAGGPALTRCLDAVKQGGRVAHPNGIEPEPRKRRGLRIKSYDAESGVREFERLNAAIEESRLQVPIAAVFPLEQAARAHERLESGHVLGRIVLDVGRER